MMLIITPNWKSDGKSVPPHWYMNGYYAKPKIWDSTSALKNNPHCVHLYYINLLAPLDVATKFSVTAVSGRTIRGN